MNVAIHDGVSKRPVGRMLSTADGKGLALVRLSSIHLERQLFASASEGGDGRVRVEAVKPWWWDDLMAKSPESFE